MRRACSFPVFVAVALFSLSWGCSDEGSQPLAPEPDANLDQAAASLQTTNLTPFQESLIQGIEGRRSQGLPAPRVVSMDYEETPSSTPPRILGLTANPPPTPTIKAVTVLEFASPAEAGFEEWPAVTVEGDVPEGAEGMVSQGDYTDLIKQRIAERYPYSNVDFETAPRRYVFTETIKPSDSAAPEPNEDGAQFSPGEITSLNDILMGFTVLGPNIDYSIGTNTGFCAIWLPFVGCVWYFDILNFWAGFQLDYTVATRLPMNVEIVSPEPVLEGSSFLPTSAATGMNWGPSDYGSVGVPPEDGNEFVLNFLFKAGVYLVVLEVPVVDLLMETNLDAAADFATPLGAGQVFSFPTVYSSLWGFDVEVAEADLGVTLTPQAGSDKFTADWMASGGASGSGTTTFTESGQSLSLGTLSAVDGPALSQLSIENYQYYFTDFIVDIGLYFTLGAVGYSGTWEIPITDFDLSAFTGGLNVGVHEGTSGVAQMDIPILNVPPSVTLSEVGSLPVNGSPTFLGSPNVPLIFSGHAEDPGQDDLTFNWSWGDGAPVPDQATTYPVPYSMTEEATHAFPDACFYQVSLTVEDDDGATGTDDISVVITGEMGNGVRMDGWWQHQLRGRGRTEVDEATLTCYLSTVNYMSAVFGEVRDASSIPSAHDVMFLKKNGGDPLERLDRVLMLAWLNFAHGGVGLSDMVDTDGDGSPDASFGAVIQAAEGIRSNPTSLPREIRAQTDKVHNALEGLAG